MGRKTATVFKEMMKMADAKCQANGVHEGKRWTCPNKAGPAYGLCWTHTEQMKRGKKKFTPPRKYDKNRSKVKAMIRASNRAKPRRK